MRVDLAEYTLSEEVENALASIESLKIYQKEQDFLEILTFFLNKYPNSMIQPKHISQDMLEGLFGTIRELGGDSSTQTLKSYRHALNKYQVTALVTSEIKSINYGKTNSAGSGITTLTRRLEHSHQEYLLWGSKPLHAWKVITTLLNDPGVSITDGCIEDKYDAKQTLLKSMIAEVGEERVCELWKITDFRDVKGVQKQSDINPQLKQSLARNIPAKRVVKQDIIAQGA
ncbi:hypothetical protein RhiirC2_717464 [Rhizophagus irregularis]|uniref:Uncharacterized protein n=1 Tax=Rhizophagus irregularis TaxID=588596 RepID=A0A2N1MM90_9GLOM|nr:hypothetical protein RhiirC2_717464 [Rhizophagus irregularis]